MSDRNRHAPEPLADAVSRLLDRIFIDYPERVMSAAMREAIEIVRRAYRRERAARDEFHSDFPQVCEVDE